MKLRIHPYALSGTLAILTLSLCLAGTSCRKQDLRTAAIQVPGLRSHDCVELVVKTLAEKQGIRPSDVAVDMERRLILVKYDSLNLSLKNLEHTIAKAGFEANDVPAYPEGLASLPEGCRPESP